MTEAEMIDEIYTRSSDWSIEPGEDGDIGFYVYVDGGYLPNVYSTETEALECLLAYLTGE